MEEEIIISGFGGQGALFAGQLLAYAGMKQGYHVTWIPAYGPEMRGGTARCTVVVSSDEIGSPLVCHPSCAIVLNMPSMSTFEPLVKVGGILVVNTTLISQQSERDDIRICYLPAGELAVELGDIRLTNVICLSALVEVMGLLSVDDLKDALPMALPDRHKDMLGTNAEAIDQGAAWVYHRAARGVV